MGQRLLEVFSLLVHRDTQVNHNETNHWSCCTVVRKGDWPSPRETHQGIYPPSSPRLLRRRWDSRRNQVPTPSRKWGASKPVLLLRSSVVPARMYVSRPSPTSLHLGCPLCCRTGRGFRTERFRFLHREHSGRDGGSVRRDCSPRLTPLSAERPTTCCRDLRFCPEARLLNFCEAANLPLDGVLV